jgi:hypothetical protein
MLKNRLWIALLAISIVAISVVGVSAAHVNRPTVQLAPDPTCSGSSPCIEYQNNGTGQGLEGVAKSVAGLLGVSTSGPGVRGNSTSSNGVYGVSSSSNGVFGTSTSGLGVLGRLGSASGISIKPGAGVLGDSQNDNGVAGTSVNSSGVLGVSTNEFGVAAASTNGIGVEGVSTNNVGVQGSSTNFVGVNAVGGFDNVTIGHLYPALSIVGDTTCGSGCTDSGNPLIDACPSGTVNPCDFQNTVFDLNQSGDLSISGEITTSGSCKSGCITQPHLEQQRVRFYTPRESLPTVEDFGEAQLTVGHAYVRIDPTFADTIDPHANYLVFITPEGPSRGLYVTAKTPTGFDVRENPGGQSTLAFQYRIVAKPYGENAPRLQRFTIHLPRPSLGNNNMLHPGTVAPVR